jgi:hypothetical protein
VITVNRYGRLAQQHWAKWRPTELSQIPDPEDFFSTLGLQVEEQIEELATALAGDDPGGEDYLEKLGRLRMARFTAESQVLREMVLLPPEPGHPEAEEEDDTPTWPATTDWLPTELTPDHPAYHELDDDPGLKKVNTPPDNSRYLRPNQ